ncbi:MAG: hypothetical protein ACKOEQ_07280, partial [Verrucomicrobiota bacterium]
MDSMDAMDAMDAMDLMDVRGERVAMGACGYCGGVVREGEPYCCYGCRVLGEGGAVARGGAQGR